MLPLLKQVTDLATKFFSLSKDVEKNKSDIAELRQSLKDVSLETDRQSRDYQDLRQEVRDLAAEVRSLRNEMQAGWEAQARERQMLLLQLENALLRRDAGLPPRAITGEFAPENSGENAV